MSEKKQYVKVEYFYGPALIGCFIATAAAAIDTIGDGFWITNKERYVLTGVTMTDEDRETAFRRMQTEQPDKLQAAQVSYEQAVQEYETLGYCTGYGDWRPDVNGIAVPVFSLNGSKVYGLNIGGPSFHVKKKQLEVYYAKRLIKAAKTLSVRP